MTKLDEEMLLLRDHYSPSDEDRRRVRGALGVALGAGALGAAEAITTAAHATTSQAPPAATIATGSVAKGGPVVGKILAVSGKVGTALQAGLAAKVGAGAGLSALAIAAGLSFGGGEAAVQAPAEGGKVTPPADGSISGPKVVGQDQPTPAEGLDDASADGNAEGSSARRPVDRSDLAAADMQAPPGALTDKPVAGQARSNTPEPSRREAALGRETELLAGASLALREGDQQRAEAALDRHASEFGEGKLVQEREGLRLLASCRTEHSPGLEAEVAVFLEAYPTSPLARHLRRSCSSALAAERSVTVERDVVPASQDPER